MKYVEGTFTHNWIIRERKNASGCDLMVQISKPGEFPGDRAVYIGATGIKGGSWLSVEEATSLRDILTRVLEGTIGTNGRL